jgi:hypothetical protein
VQCSFFRGKETEMNENKNNDCPGLVEIILILLVLIVLVCVFRGHLVMLLSELIRRLTE